MCMKLKMVSGPESISLSRIFVHPKPLWRTYKHKFVCKSLVLSYIWNEHKDQRQAQRNKVHTDSHNQQKIPSNRLRINKSPPQFTHKIKQKIVFLIRSIANFKKNNQSWNLSIAEIAKRSDFGEISNSKANETTQSQTLPFIDAFSAMQ